MLLNRFRLQEAALDDKGGGGGDKANQGAANGEWLKPFGDGAKTFESFKQPADLVKAWTDTTTELTTLKANAGKFDFRKELGGDDEAVGKVLARYTDPKAVGKALIEAQNKIRTGEFAKPLPKDATEEQVKEWRTANGVPEKFEGYLEKLPDGLVIGTDDMPAFKAVAKELHGINASPQVMHTLAKWYYADAERQAAATVELDKKQVAERNTALKEAWGVNYTDNVGVTLAHLDGLGTDGKAAFLNARLPDGRLLVNSPEIMQFLATQAREINPAAGLMPPGSEGNLQSVEGEIAAIEGLMKTNRKAYNADTKKQERLRQLYDVRMKLQAKK